jgi:lipopolysaccharide biosynthesis glycosyltransferase
MADEFPGSFLWLDVDTLPLSGWQQIFEVLDFNSLVGAVPEGKNQTKSATYDELLKRFDGNEAFLKNGLQYFNTGVIFINAQKWRDSYFSAQWRELLDSYSDYRFQFLDQCILNFLVGPDYVELPRQFNVNASQKAFNPDLKILHFLGKPKPWEIRRHAFSNFGSTQGRILWRRIEKDFLRFAKPLSSEDRELIRISRENLITISWLRDFLNRGLKNRLIPFVVKLRAYVRS